MTSSRAASSKPEHGGDDLPRRVEREMYVRVDEAREQRDVAQVDELRRFGRLHA